MSGSASALSVAADADVGTDVYIAQSGVAKRTSLLGGVDLGSGHRALGGHGSAETGHSHPNVAAMAVADNRWRRRAGRTARAIGTQGSERLRSCSWRASRWG